MMTRPAQVITGVPYAYSCTQAQKSAGLIEDHEIAGDNTFVGGVGDGGGVGAEGGSGGASAPTATGGATREGGEGVVGGVAGSGLNAIRKARSRRWRVWCGGGKEACMHVCMYALGTRTCFI